MLKRNPIFIKNVYNTIEKEFETKKRFCKLIMIIFRLNFYFILADRDWMAKNTQEKP